MILGVVRKTWQAVAESRHSSVRPIVLLWAHW